MTTVMTPSGKVTSRFLRLFSRAPRMAMALPLVWRRSGRISICNFAGDVGAGERVGRLHDVGGRALGDQAAAVASGAGAEVDDVVGAADGVFVVFNHEHGVAEVAQVFERGEQAVVVAMMQADGRLVEHVENAAQLGSDLRGQPDALAFSAGERGGGADERNVAEADGVQKLQPLHDLVHDAAGDEFFASLELNLLRDFE